MITSRRGFIGSILALSTAPAIVKAESLMKIVVPKHKILIAKPWPDLGLHSVFNADGLVIRDAYGNTIFSANKNGVAMMKAAPIRGDLWIDPESGKLRVWNHEDWVQAVDRVRRKQVL